MGDSLTNASIPLGICFKTYSYGLISTFLGISLGRESGDNGL